SLGYYIEGIGTGQRLAPTLARLERLAIDSFEKPKALFHHLNVHCTHLWIERYRISSSHLRKSLHLNPRLFEQLTHLHLSKLSDIEALHLLCKHATELHHLSVWFDSE